MFLVLRSHAILACAMLLYYLSMSPYLHTEHLHSILYIPDAV